MKYTHVIIQSWPGQSLHRWFTDESGLWIASPSSVKGTGKVHVVHIYIKSTYVIVQPWSGQSLHRWYIDESSPGSPLHPRLRRHLNQDMWLLMLMLMLWSRTCSSKFSISKICGRKSYTSVFLTPSGLITKQAESRCNNELQPLPPDLNGLPLPGHRSPRVTAVPRH